MTIAYNVALLLLRLGEAARVQRLLNQLVEDFPQYFEGALQSLPLPGGFG